MTQTFMFCSKQYQYFFSLYFEQYTTHKISREILRWSEYFFFSYKIPYFSILFWNSFYISTTFYFYFHHFVHKRKISDMKVFDVKWKSNLSCFETNFQSLSQIVDDDSTYTRFHVMLDINNIRYQQNPQPNKRIHK